MPDVELPLTRNGLSYPSDWDERTFSIRADDTTMLEPI